MRRILLQQLKTGMVLAKTIYGPAGQVLLSKGAEVKSHYAVYLRHLGIDSIYVEDTQLDDYAADDFLKEETRQDARMLVREIMEGASKYKEQKPVIFDDQKIKYTVNKIIDELLSNDDIINNLLDIRTAVGYTFAHAVNTCVLATYTAVKLKYQLPELKALATGSLLHDIGYVVVPSEILQKRGILENEEFGLVKTHPIFGLELIKQSSLYQPEIGAVIHQHHERRNGEGYPRGLTGKQIDPFAQIAAIADVYDALTSPRPYREAYQPHQAVEMIMAWGGTYFKMDIIHAFLSFIAAYPVGSHVMLSNGESGLVIANTPGSTMRPVVRVLYTGEGMAPHYSPYEVDLTEKLDLTITRAVIQ